MKNQKWIRGLIAVVAGIVLLMSSSGEALAASLVGVYENQGASTTLNITYANDSTGKLSGQLTTVYKKKKYSMNVLGKYTFTQGGVTGALTTIVFSGMHHVWPNPEIEIGQAWAGITKAYEYDKLEVKGTMVVIEKGNKKVTTLQGPLTRQREVSTALKTARCTTA